METTKRGARQGTCSHASSIANLAFTWKAQGRNVKAIDLIEECIHLHNRILGVDDYSDTLSSSAALTGWQR